MRLGQDILAPLLLCAMTACASAPPGARQATAGERAPTQSPAQSPVSTDAGESFDRKLSSYAPNYAESVRAAQAWALQVRPGHEPKRVDVRLVAWSDEHLRKVVSPRLVALSLRDNGVTVDALVLTRAPSLEVLVLNGSDLTHSSELSRLKRLVHLGLADTTSDDGLDVSRLIAGLPRLEALEIGGGFLLDADTETLRTWVVPPPTLRKLILRVEPRVLERPDARQRLERAADVVRGSMPHVRVILEPKEQDEGTEVNP